MKFSSVFVIWLVDGLASYYGGCSVFPFVAVVQYWSRFRWGTRCFATRLFIADVFCTVVHYVFIYSCTEISVLGL